MDDLGAALPEAAVDLPRNQPLLGAPFEPLATLVVRVHAQNAGARVGHLRTWNDDRGIDLIVSAGRRLLAIEVKLAAVPDRRDTRHLRWFFDRIAPDPADAMIITTGRYAYRDRDGIAVVPAASWALTTQPPPPDSDELTSALDPETTTDVLDLVQALASTALQVRWPDMASE